MTTETAPRATEDRAPPVEPTLRPQLGSHWALSPWQFLLVLIACMFFVLVDHTSLRPTDLWVHVSFGEWIVSHARLPAEDPFQIWAEGVPVVASAWLSQVAYATLYRLGGGELLSHVFAFTMLASLLLLARAAYLESKSSLVAAVAMIACIGVSWSRLLTIRPENFGWLLFCAVLLWLTRLRQQSAVSEASAEAKTANPIANNPAATVPPAWPMWVWIVLPLCFALWANLHGSFVIGLAAVGCCFVGELADALLRTRSLRSTLRTVPWMRWTILVELCATATLVNPYGIELWFNTLSFAANSNLRDILEWFPMTLNGVAGREFAVSIVILLAAFRFSRRRIPVWHVLMLVLFGLAAANQVRMIGWYGPVFGLAIAGPLASIGLAIQQRFARRRSEEPPVAETAETGAEKPQAAVDDPHQPTGLDWVWLLVSILVVAGSVIATPLSDALFKATSKSKGRSVERLYGSDVPMRATLALRKSPPEGAIFNPQPWGDWLVQHGPPGIKVFVTSNIHLTPPSVWRDYLRISGAQAGWQAALERYRLETVVADREANAALVNGLRRSDQWQLRYEDPQCAIFSRVRNAKVFIDE